VRGLIKADSGARVFHYGWCNPPEVQVARVENLGRRMFGELDRREHPASIFDGVSVRRYAGVHPIVVADRVRATPASPHSRERRMPAWLRATSAVMRAPMSRRHAARPFLPLSLTNTWWRAVDWWHAPAVGG
jgi:hypothetical protein